MTDREQYMREAIDNYKFDDLGLTLRQAIAVRDAMRSNANDDLVRPFYSRLSKGIEYAYEFCRDQALSRSILNG